MAERNHELVECLGRKVRMVAVSFAPNGSSALVAGDTKVNGGAASAAYVSTGLYRITFGDKYVSLLSAVATLQLASGDDKYVQLGTYTAADKTLDVRVWDASGGAVADVAADANNRINLICIFSDALTV